MNKVVAVFGILLLLASVCLAEGISPDPTMAPGIMSEQVGRQSREVISPTISDMLSDPVIAPEIVPQWGVPPSSGVTAPDIMPEPVPRPGGSNEQVVEPRGQAGVVVLPSLQTLQTWGREPDAMTDEECKHLLASYFKLAELHSGEALTVPVKRSVMQALLDCLKRDIYFDKE